MGASAGCCNAATLTRNREKINPNGPGDVPIPPKLEPQKPAEEFRSISTYKSLYTEKSKMPKTSKVINITSRDSSNPYVCRRMPLPLCPQKSIQKLAQHCWNLSNLEHPHICKFVEAFQDTRELLLIYEKADPTTLFDYVKERGCLTEEDASDYLRQAAMALNVAHLSNLFHGRLMPSKILLGFKDAKLDEEDATVQLKICDWGQTFVLQSDVIASLTNPDDVPLSGRGGGSARGGGPMSARGGAPMSARGKADKKGDKPGLSNKMPDILRYCAPPEIVNRELMDGVTEGECPKADQAGRNDIWALGAIMFLMLTGSPPFATATTKEAIMEAVETVSVDFDSKAWGKLSENCRDAIEMMLKVNSSLRITASKLLMHPWIKVAKVTFPKKRMVHLLQNLHLNIDHCEFTRFVLRVVSEQLPPDSKQVETVEDAFRCLDSNGDAVLSVPELTKGLKRYINSNENELNQMFAAIDRDGSGTLNVQEFVAATMDQRRCLSVECLWQAFNAFDGDQSGHVTFDEIEKVVKEVEGNQLGRDRVDALCSEIRDDLEHVTVGKNMDKSLDFDQFVYIMQNESPNCKQALKKDWYRFGWNRCGVDCHDVRHHPPNTDWKHFHGGKATDANPRRGSVYAKKKNKGSDEPEVTG